MTIQEQYSLIKEGKGSKDHFIKQALRLFPEYVSKGLDYNTTVNILKNKSILHENVGSSISPKKENINWIEKFNKNINEGLLDSMIDKIMANLTSSVKKEIIEIYKKEVGWDALHKGLDINSLTKNDYKEFLNQIKEKDTEALRKIMNKTQNISEGKELETPDKEVLDTQKHNFDNKNKKNIDNLYGTGFLSAYYVEAKDPKNSNKTAEEIKDIVAKNMAKDINYYVKDGQFGIKGLGYQTSKETKEVKGEFKSSGAEIVKADTDVLKNAAINAKASSKTTGLKAPVLKENQSKKKINKKPISLLALLNETEFESDKDGSDGDREFDQKQQDIAQQEYDWGLDLFKQGKTKEAEEYYQKALKTGGWLGWTEVDLPPYSNLEENNSSIKENYMGNKGDKVQISLSGSKSQPHYILEKPDGSAQIDMFFSSEEEAKKYADKKGLEIVPTQSDNDNEEWLDEKINKKNESIGKNYPGTLTGEYEGEPVTLEGDQLHDWLCDVADSSINVDDFIRKVTYGLTDSGNSLSTEDEDKLLDWHEKNYGDNLTEKKVSTQPYSPEQRKAMKIKWGLSDEEIDEKENWNKQIKGGEKTLDDYYNSPLGKKMEDAIKGKFNLKENKIPITLDKLKQLFDEENFNNIKELEDWEGIQVDSLDGKEYEITFKDGKYLIDSINDYINENKIPAIKELDGLKQFGVTYELNPQNKVNPISKIVVPMNLEDEEYTQIEDVLDRYNLTHLKQIGKDKYLNENKNKMNITEQAINKFKEWKNKPLLITEEKKPKKENVATRLKKIEGISEEIALEAKIEAIAEEIERRNQKITMAETMDELQEFVNPAKLKEIKNEIKELERYKMKCERLYEKMTGKKNKAESPVVDNGEVATDEKPEVEKLDEALDGTYHIAYYNLGEEDNKVLGLQSFDTEEEAKAFKIKNSVEQGIDNLSMNDLFSKNEVNMRYINPDNGERYEFADVIANDDGTEGENETDPEEKMWKDKATYDERNSGYGEED